MFNTVEFKLYPSVAQEIVLSKWMRTACWIYNRALEQRKKAYERRKQSVSMYDQCKLLTEWRKRIPDVKALPLEFARDALRRVDRAFNAFFKRIKGGSKTPGYPRFKSFRRYESLELLNTSKPFNGSRFHVAKMGPITFRAGNQDLSGQVKLYRIIRRASGWFGQALLEDGKDKPKLAPVQTAIGIDVGLNSFATFSTGETIPNPRFGRKVQKQVKQAQRKVSRRVKGSHRRRRAVHDLRKIHERVAAQRKAFAHKHSTDVVRRFDLIGYENLNIKGMVKGRFAKSIMDAAWGTFTRQIVYKAENAGKHSFSVNPRKTSQECPWCGKTVKKELSERQHQCSCRPGVVIDRDHAVGLVIGGRAVGLAMASDVEVSASVREKFRVSGTVEASKACN